MEQTLIEKMLLMIEKFLDKDWTIGSCQLRNKWITELWEK